MSITGLIKRAPFISDMAKAYYYGIYKSRCEYNDVRPFKNDFIKKEYGSLNPDKSFCVIYEKSKYLGTFETWFIIAAKVYYAVQMGMIPIIDFKNYKPDGLVGSFADQNINRWDINFKQYQEEYSLDEIYRSKNVFFFKEPFEKGFLTGTPSMNMDACECFRQIYKRIGVKEDKYHMALNAYIPDKTVGVIIRRGMERGNKLRHSLYIDWKGHHTRGHIDSYCRWIDNELNRGTFNSFFVATDDRETLTIIEQRFGNHCISCDRKRFHNFKDGEPVPPDSQEFAVEFSDRYYMGEESELGYISETLMLAKCNSVLWNPGGQQEMARVMTEKGFNYIDNHIFLDMYD